VKLAFLGDVHLISENDRYRHLHANREFFMCAWPSFRRLLRTINEESPDLTILLGDLVDWFSPENITFALDLVSALRSPWRMIPGNHDIEKPMGGYDQSRYVTESSRHRLQYWESLGVELSNRAIDVNGWNLLLLDNSLSDVTDGTLEAARRMLAPDARNLLCAHVPLDLPIIRDSILSVDPNRNLAKYVSSGAPDLYPAVARGNVTAVFSGHLHFPGLLRHESTTFHLCGMSIGMHDPNRDQTTVAQALIVESSGGELTRRVITAGAGP
jgi:3',5'-cyclic AMP phosphodiesterase CpdA